MTTLTVPQFRGGLNLTNPTAIEDNQFEQLTNFFYNDSKRVQTRRGIKTFGKPIPDATVLLNACDATTNFAVASDATNLALGTAIRGSNSISFNITVATSADNFAILSNSSLSADITTKKGYFAFWFKPPTGFNTNLTNVQVRLGSDSSNYYEWTLSTLTEASNNFVVLLFSAASTTGTPNDASITYFRLIVNYTAGYTNKTGILIDSLYCYSATSTKPTTSQFFFQRDDTFVRTLLAVSGANMFQYNETSTYWEVINTGLTEFETATGRTTERTRWDFVVYKNIIYMCNGVDNYRAWNGTLITEYAGQPKFRYLEYLEDGDRVAGAGDDSNPSTFYYTAAAPADASNVSNSSLVIGGDQLGKINGIKALGQQFLVGKDRKIYAIDITNTDALPLDAQGGWYSNRSFAIVGNGMLYQSDRGIDQIMPRSGISGAAALESKPYSEDLQPLIRQITPKQYNANCGFYLKPINNYYFSFDTNNDNVPDTTLIYSSLTGTWSQYDLPNLYSYGEYIDSDGVVHYLISSGVSGNLFEIEKEFDDLDIAIEHSLKTKAWDFGDSSNLKDFKFVDILGLASEGVTIDVSVLVDGEVAVTAQITDAMISLSSTATPIGASPVGVSTIGGGGTDTEIDIYPYKIKIPLFAAGGTIQVQMESDTINTQWTLDQMEITYDSNVFDIYPTANIA